jgi:hypothetical protein
MFNRLGAGHFKGEKTGLGFKVGMFVKALGILAPKSIEFLFEIPSLCSIHPLGSGPQLVN